MARPRASHALGRAGERTRESKASGGRRQSLAVGSTRDEEGTGRVQRSQAGWAQHLLSSVGLKKMQVSWVALWQGPGSRGHTKS